MKNSDIQALREDYSHPALRRDHLHSDAFDQFFDWFRHANEQQVPEPNAMTLSTVSQAGIPSARVVLLKGVTERKGISFYTNYDSRKAREINSNPFGALTFCWLQLARQICIQGRIVKLPVSESEEYFHSRPRGSQVGAWVSIQSEIIENRDVLQKKLAAFEEKFAGQETIPLPPNWGGYELIPTSFEFWQGNDDRLHDRFLYELHDGAWTINRLSP